MPRRSPIRSLNSVLCISCINVAKVPEHDTASSVTLPRLGTPGKLFTTPASASGRMKLSIIRYGKGSSTTAAVRSVSALMTCQESGVAKRVPFLDSDIEAKHVFYSPASPGFAPKLPSGTPAPERASWFCTDAESANSEMPRKIEVTDFNRTMKGFLPMEVGKKFAVFAIVLALCALAAGVYTGWNRPIAAAEGDFIGVCGEKFALPSLKGKNVQGNFWATFCKVCVGGMPQVVQA